MSEDPTFFSMVQGIPLLYLVMQIAGLIFFRGRLRTGAWLCALVMAGLILFVLYATVIGGSNIAPIWIVFGLPVVTVVLAALWSLHLFHRPANRV